MTRGHRGSLLLRCRAFSSPISMPVYPGAFPPVPPECHPSAGRSGPPPTERLPARRVSQRREVAAPCPARAVLPTRSPLALRPQSYGDGRATDRRSPSGWLRTRRTRRARGVTPACSPARRAGDRPGDPAEPPAHGPAERCSRAERRCRTQHQQWSPTRRRAPPSRPPHPTRREVASPIHPGFARGRQPWPRPSAARMPSSVAVICASTRDRWCCTTNDRRPTCQSAWPGPSWVTTRASASVRPSS